MARRHTVLIVDDEPDVVKSVQDLLRLDYRVLGATRASEGIKLLQAEEVHVVMSDQRMPEMTGVQFFNHIRGQHPDAIRLLFTGYADIAAVIDAINHGNVYRYITKPWDPDELQLVIREAVSRYERIVDHKQLSEELRSKNEQLEKRCAGLLQEGNLKTAFVQAANRELTAPAALAAALVDGYSGDAVSEAATGDAWRRVSRPIERINQLLKGHASQLAANDFSPRCNPDPITVDQLLQRLLDDVRPLAQTRRRSIVLDDSSKLITPVIDGCAVRDGLAAVVLRALEHVPSGGQLRISGSRCEHGVELRITGVAHFATELPSIDGFLIRVENQHGLHSAVGETVLVTIVASG